MNSTVSDDLTRDHLALEAAKCLKNISLNTQNVNTLHKELLEINLSITTYIEESKQRLEELRLQLAHEAKSSQRVVEILSDKQKMSNIPPTPKKPANHSRSTRPAAIKHEDNNNSSFKSSQHQNARKFINWYKHMIDNERQNLSLYLSDDAILEWFGKTIKTRKKVTTFLKYDMQCSRHDFTTVESIERIQSRHERQQRKDDPILASPLNSPEVIRSRPERCGKRRLLRSNCNSPEWAEGCNPDDECNGIEKKRFKSNHEVLMHMENHEHHNVNVNRVYEVESNVISNRGDGEQAKGKCVLVTPPNLEKGQGDCLPSTSGTDSDRSHDALNAQLPKLAVECNGYIEFTRSRNSRSVDSMKWERKCKVQISYSEDPLNVGEYIVWAVRYYDESKCRRNLLAAFEEVAKEEEIKKL